MSASGKPRVPEGERVWEPPANFAFADQLRGLGGTVAPVLAGFSLAAIVTLETAGTHPELHEWSLAAFSASAVLLLMAMQLSSRALGRSAPPSVRLEWMPLATEREDHLTLVRQRQLEDMVETRVAWRRAGLCYDLGLNAFLIGVLTLLWADSPSWPRALAVGVTGVALAVELVWSARTWRGVLRHPLRKLFLPSEPPVAPVLDPSVLAHMLDRPAGSDGAESPTGDRSVVAELARRR